MRILIALALVLCANSARAETIEYKRDENAAFGRGTKISGLALTAARWTGWISIGSERSIALDIDFTDADSSVTSVTMVCETSRSGTTTADGGRDLHTVSIAADGTATSVPITWSYASAGSKAWTWTVSNVPAPWLNCKFTGNGVPGAGDVITVYARAISP